MHCAHSVKMALAQVAGVITAVVDLDDAAVHLELDETKFSPIKAKEAVRSKGYELIIE
jgi:copper chaperone CopZ